MYYNSRVAKEVIGKGRKKKQVHTERSVSTVLFSSVECTAMNDGWRGKKRKRENQSESGHQEQQLEDRRKKSKTKQHLKPTASKNVHQLECKEGGRKRSREEEMEWKERGREYGQGR